MNTSSFPSPLRHRRSFRLCVWTTLWLQVATPLTLSLSPVMLARADDTPPVGQSPFRVDREAAGVRTVPYTLKDGETVAQVAKAHGMTIAQLEKLNQFRGFARGFDHLKAGDELDVPAQPLAGETVQSGAPETRSPFAVDREQPADPNAQRVAGVASQAGRFLSNHPDSDAAAAMVKGMAVGKANQSVQDWMNQFGTAQVQLGVDEDFSLKSSSFNLLHPWYDTPENLVFSQTGIHRTDDRTQTNIGVGYRHFRDTDMLGANLFLDYDLSRDHARAGFGGEYWRDFLKLSANAYVGLTGWKTSPDVEDYEERPANGWDLRAEGYLPSYPQLGAKLVYEQYYGDEVGLFGKDERQKNPHALTAGLNWTPFPLLTLEANERTGKAGEHDTEFKADVNYRIGEPLSHQLDTDAVAAARSLAGSHYDLIDRNNDIILEYRKQEVIRLSLPARIEGRAGQVFPLTLNVRAKHGLKEIEWDDAALLAAGGKLSGQGTQWQLTLPQWKANTVNAWEVGAVAHDVKDNTSKRAEMQVVVTAPSVDTNASSLVVKDARLLADGASTTAVTVTLKDSAGNPVSGMADQIALSGTLAPDAGLLHRGMAMKLRVAAVLKTAPQLGAIKETGEGTGIYTATLTAGTQSGKYALTAKVAGAMLAQSTVVLEDTAADMSVSTLSADKTTLTADGADAATLTVVLGAKDENGVTQPVSGEVARLSFRVANSSHYTFGPVQEGAPGVYTTTFSGTLAATQLPVSLLINGRDSGKQVMMDLTADMATMKVNTVAPDNTTDLAADGTSAHVYTATVSDANGNPAGAGETVTWTQSGGASAVLSGTTSVTDAAGQATITLTSTTTAVNGVVVSARAAAGAAVNAAAVNFVADAATMKVDAVAPDNTTDLAADGTSAHVYTATVSDANGNPAGAGETVTWTQSGGASAVLSGTTSVTDAAGQATITLTSTTTAVNGVVVSARAAAGAAVNAAAVNFVADAATMKVDAVAPDNTTDLAADGTSAHVYTATVSDANGNPAGAGETVTWTQSGGASAVLSGTTSVTDAAGQATITLTSTTTAVNGVVVSARTAAGAAVNAAAVNFVADAATMKVDAVAPDNTTDRVADGTSAHVYTATVSDANGNPAGAGETVTWTQSGGASAVLSGTTSVTDAAGQATITLTSTTTAVNGVVVSARAAAGAAVNAAAVNFVADAATMKVDAVAPDNTTDLAADGTSAHVYTATVSDANGNPAGAGETVTWTQSGGASAVLSGTTSVTDAAGQATITLTSTTTAVNGVVVSARAAAGAAVNAAAVNFVADAATMKVDAVAPDNTTDLAADGTSAHVYTATVSDANGNPAGAGETVTWTQSGGASAVLSGTTSVTDAAGQATITLTSTTTAVNGVVVSARAAAGAAVNAAAVNFVADAATMKVDAVAPDNTTDLAADGTSAHVYTATVSDANGNPAGAGETVTWTQSGGASAVLSGTTSVTDAAGQATITLTSTTTAVNGVVVSARAAAGAAVNAAAVNFVADAATAQVVSLSLQNPAVTSKTANGTDSFVFEAVVQDGNGNPVNGATLVVSQDKGAGITATVTGSTGADGKTTVTLTGTKAVSGIQLSAAAGTTAARAADHTVTLTAGAPVAAKSTLTPAVSTVEVGTGGQTLTLTLKDAYDNLVPGQHVLTDATGAGVSAVLFTETGTGVYTATVSGTKSGDVTVLPRIGLMTPLVATAAVVTLTPGPVSAANSVVNIPVEAASQDTALTVEVTPRDAYNNYIPAATIGITATTAAGINTTPTDTGTMMSVSVLPVAWTNDVRTNKVTVTANGTELAKDRKLAWAPDYFDAGAQVPRTMYHGCNTLVNDGTWSKLCSNGGDTYYYPDTSVLIARTDVVGDDPVSGAHVRSGSTVSGPADVALSANAVRAEAYAGLSSNFNAERTGGLSLGYREADIVIARLSSSSHASVGWLHVDARPNGSEGYDGTLQGTTAQRFAYGVGDKIVVLYPGRVSISGYQNAQTMLQDWSQIDDLKVDLAYYEYEVGKRLTVVSTNIYTLVTAPQGASLQGNQVTVENLMYRDDMNDGIYDYGGTGKETHVYFEAGAGAWVSPAN